METKKRRAIADRIRETIKSRPPDRRTHERFAEDIGAGKHTTVGAWLSGRSLPGAANLRAIAELTGCSVDWLLGFDVPMRRERRRGMRTLDKEVAAYVMKRVAWQAKLEGLPVDLPGPFVLDGSRVLDEAVHHELDVLRQQLSRAQFLSDAGRDVIDHAVRQSRLSAAAKRKTRSRLLKAWNEYRAIPSEPRNGEEPVARYMRLREEHESSRRALRA